jgi:hypothetical protein
VAGDEVEFQLRGVKGEGLGVKGVGV